MELSQQFWPVLYQGKFSSVSYQIVREDKIQNSVRNTVQFVFLTLQLHRIPILFAKEYFWLLPQPFIIARLNREMCLLPLPVNNHLFYYYYLFSIHIYGRFYLLINVVQNYPLSSQSTPASVEVKASSVVQIKTYLFFNQFLHQIGSASCGNCNKETFRFFSG